MNIGRWIVVAFVLFAAFIATLVTICMRQDISLVAKDYYKQELDYESQLTRLNNAAMLKERPVIQITGNELVVEYNDFKLIDEGKVVLFCPANEKMDRTFALRQAEYTAQSFNIAGLQHGRYKARIHWRIDGKEFFREQIIMI